MNYKPIVLLIALLTIFLLLSGTVAAIDITYYPNDGTDGNTKEVTISDLQANDEVKIHNASEVNFAKTDYILIGWSETINPTENAIDHHIGSIFTMPAQSVDLYAVWGDSSAYTYSINYHPNGADNTKAPVVIYYDDKENVKIANVADTGFTKTGNILGGWNKDMSQSIEYMQDGTKNMDAEGTSTDLYAVWVEGEFKVTYTTDTPDVIGALPGESRFDLGEPVRVADGTHLIRVGWEFDGWESNVLVEIYEDTDFKTIEFIGDGTEDFHMPSSDVTLNAKWENRQSESFTVTYDGNGYTGTGIPSDTSYQYKQEVIIQSHSMDYTGHIFKGWTKDPAGSDELYDAGETFRITEDTTLYAQWYKSNDNRSGRGTGFGHAIVVNSTAEIPNLIDDTIRDSSEIPNVYQQDLNDSEKIIYEDGSGPDWTLYLILGIGLVCVIACVAYFVNKRNGT